MVLRRSALVLLAAVAALGFCRAGAQTLDPLLASPDLWQSSQGDFVDSHRDLGFHWLSDARDRAETNARGLTLFGQPIYQVDSEFSGGKLSALVISIYNRGDAGSLTVAQWQALLLRCVQSLSTLSNAQPIVEGKQEGDAVKANAVSWQSPTTRYLLEYSFTREVKTRNIPFRAEFMRLRVSPPEKAKSFMAAALAADSPSAKFSALDHIKKLPSGDVLLQTVPMVDQGAKGYCVVATAERVMRYYGVPVDEHELAELANSSASQGTSNEAMFNSLKKLSNRLRVKIKTIQTLDVHQLLAMLAEYNRATHHGKLAPEIPTAGPVLDVQQIYSTFNPDLFAQVRTRNKGEMDRFQREVEDEIDHGIPLLWSVELGLVPEKNLPSGVGGHMRLIIGYNPNTGEILYSDSWGPGHELKRMTTAQAWTMTTELNTIQPL